MKNLHSFTTPEYDCSLLPAQRASMRYIIVSELSVAEYDELMSQRWRKFGRQLFRPECLNCRACQAIRVPVSTFAPSRTQKRIWRANSAEVSLSINTPKLDPETLALSEKYHAFQADNKGWSNDTSSIEADYFTSFVDNPVPVEEWRYHVGEKLIGVGYVDAVPSGLSAVYFYYDPEERWRSPGTWNVLRVIEEARSRKLSYAYLGYYVRGCGSLTYKANFGPNEVLDYDTGEWRPFNESAE